MKKFILSGCLPALILVLMLTACGGTPKKSRCSVEVYTPSSQYSEVMLLDSKGNVIDSTLSVRNDSVRFTRDDIDRMPYVATLILTNPADSLDIISHPIVVEGGTVSLELTDRISLSGTDDNEKLFKFLKAKNSFVTRYENQNKEHNLEKLQADYSRYFTDHIMQNKKSIVGRYIYDSYKDFLLPQDQVDVREALKETGMLD